MNNKILIGSIIAVVILVLVSFTGVVGFQTTKSSTVARASPLFSVRSKRALDKESRDLTCDYIGKDKEINIHFPERNTTKELIREMIQKLRHIDEKQLERLTSNLKKRIETYKFLNKKDFNTEISIVEQLVSTLDYTTDDSLTCDAWFPLFLLGWIKELILEWILFIVLMAIVAVTLVTALICVFVLDYLITILGAFFLILLTVSPVNCASLFCPFTAACN